jgi:hypothetical protein
MTLASAGVSHHVLVRPVTIGTHRLWISLWTRLGQPEDNMGESEGIVRGNGGRMADVHTSSPARRRSPTGSVGSKTRPWLGVAGLSPASTVPTTATCCSFTKRSNLVTGHPNDGPRTAHQPYRTLTTHPLPTPTPVSPAGYPGPVRR